MQGKMTRSLGFLFCLYVHHYQAYTKRLLHLKHQLLQSSFATKNHTPEKFGTFFLHKLHLIVIEAKILTCGRRHTKKITQSQFKVIKRKILNYLLDFYKFFLRLGYVKNYSVKNISQPNLKEKIFQGIKILIINYL